MDPVFSREALGKVCVFSKAKANNGSSQTKQKSFAVTVQPSNSANQYTRKCQLCSGHHDLEECPQFLHRSVDERREFVKVNRLCFSCLGNNHTSKRCLNRRQCKTCNKRHPTTLHIENFRILDSNSAIVSQASAQSESTGQGCAKGQDGTQGEGRTPGQGNTQTLSNVRSSACTISDTVLQSILPVQLRVKGSDNVVQTYAFYDTGSTGCFIKDSIKDQLNCKGIETAIKLQTMNGTDTDKTFIVNGLVVADIHGNNDVAWS
ncbi:uncharacterized protein [Palaemon carinicauda]|uniref:uncharacterized protein n=1 Tax=Palaemon carinicauda TaxID=392227 RepID=UPI0035B5847A